MGAVLSDIAGFFSGRGIGSGETAAIERKLNRIHREIAMCGVAGPRTPEAATADTAQTHIGSFKELYRREPQVCLLRQSGVSRQLL
jgi:hypothetical protein